MHLHTASHCCQEIEALIRLDEPPSRDTLLRLMVAEKRLRLDFCNEAARDCLRTLIAAIERLWTVGMFSPRAEEAAALRAAALGALESLREVLLRDREAGPANDSLLAA
jgi:hypothetical protein